MNVKLKSLFSSFIAISISASVITTNISCTHHTQNTIGKKITPKGIVHKKVIPKDKSTKKIITGNLKIASWNLENYGTKSGNIVNKSKSQYAHAQLHDRIIAREKLDLVGVEEINASSGKTLNYDIKLLNKLVLQEKYQNTTHYSYFLSGATKPNDGNGQNTPLYDGASKAKSEMYGFIYNDLKVKPVPFITGKIGAFSGKNILASNGKHYVRTPFGVKWQSIMQNKFDFTYFIIHADPKKNTDSEAENMGEIAKYFDSIDGKNNDLIFAGDTNYKKSSASGFKTLIDYGLKPKVDGIKTSLTSNNIIITTKDQKNIYSKVGYYDRMFSTINDQYIVAKGQLYSQQKIAIDPRYQDARDLLPKYLRYSPPSLSWAKYAMSDHDAVYMTINGMNEADDK